MIPKLTIHTPRLIVRPFRQEDADHLFEYLSDPSVYTYEPGEPVDREKAGLLASDMAASPNFWAVELKSEQKLIGQLYFSQVDPVHLMTWELGYILSPKYHRRGYASEAAAALVSSGFGTGMIHRVTAHCNPDNTASWKLLEKIGFRREGLLQKNIYFHKDASGEPKWNDTYVYARLCNELPHGRDI